MFNLLPDDLKYKIKKEYKSRRLILGFIFILFIQISFIALIIPSWLTSIYKEKGVLLQTDEINKSELVLNASSTANSIKLTNSRLNVINTILDYPKMVPLIDATLSVKTKSILINQFNYIANSSSTATLSISGISDTREALVSFKKSLDDLDVFKNVDLPISNLAKEKNINFSINMTVTK